MEQLRPTEGLTRRRFLQGGGLVLGGSLAIAETVRRTLKPEPQVFVVRSNPELESEAPTRFAHLTEDTSIVETLIETTTPVGSIIPQIRSRLVRARGELMITVNEKRFRLLNDFLGVRVAPYITDIIYSATEKLLHVTGSVTMVRKTLHAEAFIQRAEYERALLELVSSPLAKPIVRIYGKRKKDQEQESFSDLLFEPTPDNTSVIV